jgi:hypothetical protein
VTQVKEDLLKRREGKGLNPDEFKELTQARRKADLILSYRKQAVRALQVKGRTREFWDIKEKRLPPALLLLVSQQKFSCQIFR